MRTKPLILVKKQKTKLRTKSGMLNIRAKRLSLPYIKNDILNLIRAKHQNRAWLLLILYCMQASLLSIFYHILFSPVTGCTENKHYKRSFLFLCDFCCIILWFLVLYIITVLLYYEKFKKNPEKPRTN